MNEHNAEIIAKLKEAFMDCVRKSASCERRGDRTHLHGEAMGLCSAAAIVSGREPADIWEEWSGGHHVA